MESEKRRDKERKKREEKERREQGMRRLPGKTISIHAAWRSRED